MALDRSHIPPQFIDKEPPRGARGGVPHGHGREELIEWDEGDDGVDVCRLCDRWRLPIRPAVPETVVIGSIVATKERVLASSICSMTTHAAIFRPAVRQWSL